jgi:hypothetical protein
MEGLSYRVNILTKTPEEKEIDENHLYSAS